MSEDDSTPTDADPASSPDYRQLAFVGLVAFALLAAAAVAPAATDRDSSSSGGDGSSIEPPADDGSGGGSPDGDGDGPDFSFDIDELLDWLDWSADRSPPDDRPCAVFLDGNPTPGGEVTAVVRYEGDPVEGATVRFNDRRIGRTDEFGRVTGEVPYDDRLRIHVDLEDRPDCELVGSTGRASATGSVEPVDAWRTGPPGFLHT